MPTRRLNYTGRQRIARRDVRITAREYPGRPATFDARDTGPPSIWLCRRLAGWCVTR